MSKIPITILGATGMVGQRFVQLLHDHPTFEITALAASPRKEGKSYREACHWVLDEDMPEVYRDMILSPIQPEPESGGASQIVFSALPADIAREKEPLFAEAGYLVCSNASAFRMEPDVPLIIPEVNAHHLSLIDRQRAQRGWKGCIVTSPNCTTTTIVMALKPLDEAFGIKKLFVATLQAVSGSGYPGLSYQDIHSNVIPFIDGEEEKIESETRILLGDIVSGERIPKEVLISAQVNRVPVVDGHMVNLSIGFEKKPSIEEAKSVLCAYKGSEVVQQLPGAPAHPVVVREEKDRPQPRRDRNTADGMVASVGRIRECPLLDLRLVAVTHNAIRGAAGGAILNAELLAAQGYIL
ncbi:MAG: aspartate-semialdehyde dehydrogenase [Anaerolineaceae bacterium]|nr:aspartate-semialdehyde dehydrogenase [Anaerolineaceae bacterium]